MPDPARELSREWLTRSEHDLRVANCLLTMSDPPPESVGFHAQQCAEKALKAFLTFHQIAFERRPDLGYLLDLCMPVDDDFQQFREPADELTPYAVEYRYPDALSSMSLQHAAKTVNVANQIYHFVLSRIDNEASV